MSAKSLYRGAAVLFVLFASGHTVGFLRFRPPTPEALAVRDAMANVHFQVGHATFTYGGFYTGFGLYITLYMVFSALLAWHVGEITETAPQNARTLGWLLCGVQAVGLMLSLRYFSVVPAMLSGLLVICLGWAAVKVPTARVRAA